MYYVQFYVDKLRINWVALLAKTCSLTTQSMYTKAYGERRQQVKTVSLHVRLQAEMTKDIHGFIHVGGGMHYARSPKKTAHTSFANDNHREVDPAYTAFCLLHSFESSRRISLELPSSEVTFLTFIPHISPISHTLSFKVIPFFATFLPFSRLWGLGQRRYSSPLESWAKRYSKLNLVHLRRQQTHFAQCTLAVQRKQLHLESAYSNLTNFLKMTPPPDFLYAFCVVHHRP